MYSVHENGAIVKREREMQRLPHDHPEVQSLLGQLQGLHESKHSFALLLVEVEHFRKDLYQRGWESYLDESGKTVLLRPVPEVQS